MKINLLVAVLFILALGCRKEVHNSSFTEQTKTFPLNSIDNISFTNDKGLFISGSSGDKYTLIKTDANLNIEWIKNDYDWGHLVRGSEWSAASYSIKMVGAFQREDGNYDCIGQIYEGGDVVYSSALIIVLNKNGKQIQKYRFDNTVVWNALKTGNGYVLFGTQLIKLDNNFNKLWTKTIYHDTYFPSEIATITDGGFVITGSYNSDQIFLEKFDANGNKLLTKAYKHNDYPFNEAGFDITQLTDAGFLIVGRTREATTSSDIINCQMIRTNSNGDTIWDQEIWLFIE